MRCQQCFACTNHKTAHLKELVEVLVDLTKNRWIFSACSKKRSYCAFSRPCKEIKQANQNQEPAFIYCTYHLGVLCEQNPIDANRPNKDKYSEYLPIGLASPDESTRKSLFYENSKGLSAPTRTHMLDNKNEVTFVAYCESVMDDESFAGIFEDFEVSAGVDRTPMFKAIFSMFLAFANTGKKEVPDDFLEKFFTNPAQVDAVVGNTSYAPLFAGDDISFLRPTRNPPETAKIYDKINFYWKINNTGKVSWSERYMKMVNFDHASLRLGNGDRRTIEISEIPPGGEVDISVAIEMRAKAGEKELVLNMMDKNGRLCFPDGRAQLRFSMKVELGIEL